MANETPDIVPELAELRKPYVLPMPDPFSTQTSAAVTGTTMPKIDTKALGKVGTRDRLDKIRQQEANLLQEELESKGYISQGEQQIAEYKAKGLADITKQESAQARGINQSVESFREKNPAPELTPTKDNIQSLSTLFGLIGVIGMAMGGAGKQSATASLNAMGGMMKGWQQGRADLWKKEVQEFDKNMLTWKSKLDDAMKKAEAAYKILPYNRAEAESRLNEVIATLGSGLLKEKNRQQGFTPTYQLLENLAKDADSAIKESGVERRHQETIAANKALETMKETAASERAEDAARQKLMEDVRKRQLGPIEKKEGGTGAGAKGVGQIQFRYNAVVTNNIEQIKNGVNQIMAFETSQMPPALGEALTNPAGGIATGVESYLSRTMSPREERLFQQAGAGLKMAITNVEASGLSRGASAGAQKEYGKMEPRGGDSVLSKFMYLAEVRQIAELGLNDLKTSGGTKEQIERAEALVREVKSQVTWTVPQVVAVATKSKSLTDDDIDRLAEQAEGMQNFLSTLSSARATAKSKDAAATPSATLNGRKIVVSDGKWVYQDTGEEAK
jgi:hypothetical protein